MANKIKRLRRALKTRLKLKELMIKKLVVHKSNTHIYAQIINETGIHTLVSASSLDSICKQKLIDANLCSSGLEAAKVVGQLIANRALMLGITKVGFDRSGFLFHGKIKALAEAARASGLLF